MTAKILALPPRHGDMAELITEMQEADLSECVVIGWKRDGGFFIGDNGPSVRESIALLAIANHVLLECLLGDR